MDSRFETLVTQLVVERGADDAHWQISRLLTGRATEAQRAAARDEHGNDERGVDEDALVSEADDGYWVQGWLWVRHPDCGTCDGVHDPALDCRAAYPAKGS